MLPHAAEPLIARFSVAFYPPTFQRFILLTVAAILWTVRSLMHGHVSSYHRLFSRSPCSPWTLARVLAAILLERIPQDQPVVASADDTTALHKGKKVYGNGCHHAAVRSTHTQAVWKWGHKWFVLAINVRFPFATRPWALLVLMALYKPEELNKQEGRRHRTPIDLTQGLMAALIRWFPTRTFILPGDGGYASHDLARFTHRHRKHLTLVSRFRPDANHNALPAKPSGTNGGRPRKKERKLSPPQQVVARSKRTRSPVRWYGGGPRRIECVSQGSPWSKGGGGLVPLRWVFVHDLDGTHRDESFYSTDSDLKPAKIVSLFIERWSIEVTFQEVREHVCFDGTKHWRAKSVLRGGRCLLGLFSLVSLISARLSKTRRPAIRKTPWYDKSEPTFSDALYAVRRLLWSQTALKQALGDAAVSKLPTRLWPFFVALRCSPLWPVGFPLPAPAYGDPIHHAGRVVPIPLHPRPFPPQGQRLAVGQGVNGAAEHDCDGAYAAGERQRGGQRRATLLHQFAGSADQGQAAGGVHSWALERGEQLASWVFRSLQSRRSVVFGSGADVLDQGLIRNRLDLHRLLCQPAKQLGAPGRGAAVETQRELVQVVVPMLRLHRSVMRARQPALQERCYPMHPRQQRTGVLGRLPAPPPAPEPCCASNGRSPPLRPRPRRSRPVPPGP